jgi:hypothetical protein
MSTPVRHSRRLAAKPRVNYSELDEDEFVVVRTSSRLAAKPRVDYAEKEETAPAVSLPAPASPAPAAVITIRITEKPVDEEKQRIISHFKGLLLKIDNIKGDKPARAAGAVEIMQYTLTCKEFCDKHPRFRDTVIAKCYELKKYNGEEFPEVASACDAVLHMFGKPLEVPTVLPVVMPSGACGDCSGCKTTEEKLRAELEARHVKAAAKAAEKPAPAPAPAAPVPVDIFFLRQQLRRIQGEMEDAETDGYFHSLVDDYLAYVRKPEVLEALKKSPSDRMIARGIIRQYEGELCGHHQETLDDFLALCPI